MSKGGLVKESYLQADLSIRLRAEHGNWAKCKGHLYLSRLKRERYTAEQTNMKLCVIHVGE